MSKLWLVIGVTALILQGCATPFSKFYRDTTGVEDIRTAPNVAASTGQPQLILGENEESDAKRMAENDYYLIGYSSFNGGDVDGDGAVKQAEAVHAAAVILYIKYTGTQSGVIPLTLPDTQTTTTSTFGTLNGSVGLTNYAGNYTGTSYTTTNGTRTTYIPYSVRRSDYLATYWVKLKPPVFGTFLQPLPDATRQELGSNEGEMVYAVVNSSPAFHAGVLAGDVLLKIGAITIESNESYQQALSRYQNSTVMVELYRNGVMLHKRVTLGTLANAAK